MLDGQGANVGDELAGHGGDASTRRAPAAKPTRPRRRPLPRLLRIGALLAVLAVVAYGLVWAYRYAIALLGVFAPLAAVALLALLAVFFVPWLLIHYRHQLGAAVLASIAFAKRLALRTGLPQRFAARFPRLAHFLAARFAPAPATGLTLTVGLFLIGALLWFQLELLVEVISGSPVVATDRRVLNLVATLRTPHLDSVMYALTYLGNVRTIVALTLVAVIVALLGRRRLDAVLVVFTVVGSGLFFEAVKLLVHRPRPPLEDARIVQGGFSFPSGHSTIAATFYGTLAFLLIRLLRSEPLRVLIGVVAGLLIAAIGLSRIYLGVHYPSDVLAGWAAGALWVVLLVLAERIWNMHPRIALPPWRRVAAALAGPLLTLAAVTVLVVTYVDIPPPLPPTPAPVTLVSPGDVPAVTQAQLPHYTETLFGHRQEPISIVLVGTRAQVEAAFTRAGWSEARRLTLEDFGQEVVAAVEHSSDPAGPVTPSFLAEEPNALAFSQEVNGTLAQRHHIRLWTTTLQTVQGQDVWLATASFDRGFELAPNSFLPTHQIDPNIDAERAYVVAALTATGLVAQTQTVQLVPPESGHNFAGDPFMTDGQAVVVWLTQ